MLSEKKIALEELKFCLITCEVVYNTELAELLDLSKRSVSWADPLPSFNRRTIASTIEKGMATFAFMVCYDVYLCCRMISEYSCVDKIKVIVLRIQNYFKSAENKPRHLENDLGKKRI
jgi:hypothetical protein